MPKASLPTLSPATAQHTEQAIAQYEGIVARGGWPEVPKIDRLRLGARNPSVVALRQRLTLAGDLDPNAGVSDVYDSYVEAAVRRFQARHGLAVDGIIREQTLKALNVPAQVRLAQLAHQCWCGCAAMSGNLGARFVVCNIPGRAHRGDRRRRRGVAPHRRGRQAGPRLARHQQPDRRDQFQSVLDRAGFDRAPRPHSEDAGGAGLSRQRTSSASSIRSGNELTPSQINWYSEEAVNYRFKQDPGDLNSLGSIRINFPSTHGVYMHDTPSKNLFGEDFRFHSSGCVRVQNVRELVNWLLVETPGWSRPEIDQVIKSGERKDAKVLRPVPLYWVYVTAWATPDGVVQFRDDIYNRDGLGADGCLARLG